MLFGWVKWFSLRLAPHFLCRCATGNAPAIRRKRIASVVMGSYKKRKEDKNDKPNFARD